jgi:hypothetical protein
MIAFDISKDINKKKASKVRGFFKIMSNGGITGLDQGSSLRAIGAVPPNKLSGYKRGVSEDVAQQVKLTYGKICVKLTSKALIYRLPRRRLERDMQVGIASFAAESRMLGDEA